MARKKKSLCVTVKTKNVVNPRTTRNGSAKSRNGSNVISPEKEKVSGSRK
jgi:hypothetical protein